MKGHLLMALLNAVALSYIAIGTIWKCEKCYPAQEYYSDAPSNAVVSTNDGGGNDNTVGIERMASSNAIEPTPSYLQWNRKPPRIPDIWTFKTPRFCKNATDFQYNEATHGEQKIIVHYHLQHNAGTEFWGVAKQFVPCATRSCWQTYKHCLVSYNEEVEANNIRQNYREYGVQYVSYELMLPPHFPLPFVSAYARKGLFFTTIVRDPFRRFLTYFRRHEFTGNGLEGGSPFFIDLRQRKQEYAGDNLNVRWLSGALESINSDHVNIAKCRLQLFDLVIADKLFDYAVKKVMCPLNNWKGKGKRFCDEEMSDVEHESKPDPLNTTDTILIGAWIERLRPSFEIYDYARLLSWKQLKEKGVKDLPELSEVPSYMATLQKYTNMTITDEHFKKIKSISLENEEHFHPPVEFCNKMKRIWTSNPDEVPNVYGLGTLRDKKVKQPGRFIYSENL